MASDAKDVILPGAMKKTPDDFLSLLRGGALLWSAYFLLLGVFDAIRIAPRTLPVPYTLFYGSAMTLVSLLALAPRIPAKLGRAYPLLLLTMTGFLPFLGEAFILSRYDLHPWISVLPTNGVYVRQWFPTFMTAVLVAYGYGWGQVVLLVVGITTLNVALAASRIRAEALPTAITIAFIFGTLLIATLAGVDLVLKRLRRQEADLRSANEELLQLASAMEDLATSRERNRMARELHDTLAHSLSSLLIQLETVDAYWEVNSATAKELLARAEATARSGLNDTRRALQALRANPLDDLGLELALRELAETAAQRGNLKLSFGQPRFLPQLSSKAEQCIYRVAQEATTNVVQHAHARHLDVWLSQSDGWITLNVHDDGVGFVCEEASHPGHYGVPGMEERATLAGGRLAVTTGPAEGTTIALSLPIRNG